MERVGERIVIKGVTRSGRKFRPSDWAQRLATAVARQGPGRRIIFHPRVCMANRDGVNCVVVDTALEQEEPMLYRFLLNFARENDLQIAEERPTPPASS